MTEPTSPITPKPDPTSIFGNLAKRSKEIEDGQRITLQVPRWTDPEIFVIYKPVDFARLDTTAQRVENAKDADRAAEMINGHMDTLIEACIGVYARIDGERYSFGEDPRGDLTRFDRDLGKRLALEDDRARAVVRALFKTDGDIIATVTKLSTWSGYEEQKLEDTRAGE